jgi:hypothetical protein
MVKLAEFVMTGLKRVEIRQLVFLGNWFTEAERWKNGFEREDYRLLSAALQISYSDNGCLYAWIRVVNTSNQGGYRPGKYAVGG